MKLNRWAIILSGYDFQIVYIEGQQNYLADSLSRFIYTSKLESENDKSVKKCTKTEIIKTIGK